MGKNEKKVEGKDRGFLVLPACVLLYLVIGAFLLKYYRYVINPDGISYISAAKRYLAGNFGDAINGFWGPMISWLMVPLLAMKIEALLAAKILNLLIGAVAIVMVWLLSGRFSLSKYVKIAVAAALVPIMLSFAMGDVTPDLLLMTVVGFYLFNIFDPNYSQDKNRGWMSGLWGGLSYLAKSYAFPFFIVHFFVMNVIHFFRSQTKEARIKVLTNFVIGYAVFAVVSGIWIGLISHKYGELTFSAAGKVALGSDVSKGYGGLGMYWQGFLEPPYKTAYSIWDEPSSLKPIPKKPVSFGVKIAEQWQITKGILKEMVNMFFVFSVLTVIAGAGYVWFWIRYIKTRKMPPIVLFSTVAILIFAGGYSLVKVNERYIWILFVITMLMVGYIFTEAFKRDFFRNPAVKIIVLAVFVILFASSSIKGLKERSGRGENMYESSKVLANIIKPQSRIASDTNWPMTLYLAYYLDCRYYGIPQEEITKEKLTSDLKKYGIQYFVVWSRSNFSFLTDYREITGGRMPGLRVYALKTQ